MRWIATRRRVALATTLGAFVCCSGGSGEPVGDGGGLADGQRGLDGSPYDYGSGWEVPPWFTDGGICADVKVDAGKVIPTLVLLIDQSGSMKEDFGGVKRWNAVHETLMDQQDGVVKRLEAQVRFGVTLYTSDSGFKGGTCPMLKEVTPALTNYAAIAKVYKRDDWDGDTPTGESLQKVAEQLDALVVDGPKVIVLATDGEPDTCEDSSSGGRTEGRKKTVAAAKWALQRGIRTYVISVGKGVGEDHLKEVAEAGVGQAGAPFFKALQKDELVKAFGDIVGQVVDCTFTLNGQIHTGLASQGRVSLDGKPLKHGDDWKLVDETTLEILGPSCETIKAGGDHTLEAIFPCGAVIK